MLRKITLIITLGFLFTSVAVSQVDVWYAKGEKAYYKKNYQEAIDAFTKVVYQDPNNSQAYFMRGMSYMFTEKFNKAIEDLTVSLDINPSNADASNARGLAYGYIGEVELAIADFDKAISIDPQFTEAYINRGAAYVSWYNYPMALKDFDRALELNPKNPAIFYQRGLIYYKQKKYTKAASDYTKAINMGLDHAKVYYNRGNAYFKASKWKKAIKDYTKVIELDPKDTEARNNRAMAYQESGQNKKAEADRRILNKMSGNKFPPIESLKFKKFYSPHKVMSMDMPRDWHLMKEVNKDVIEFWLTQDKLSSKDQPYTVGAWVSYNKNMYKNYKIPEGTDLIEFWKSSNMMNAESYHAYDIFSQKQFQRNGYFCIMNKVRLIVNDGDLPLRMYEMVMAKGSTLVVGYFRAPERQFGYYKQIYEKAIDSFWPL